MNININCFYLYFVFNHINILAFGKDIRNRKFEIKLGYPMN